MPRTPPTSRLSAALVLSAGLLASAQARADWIKVDLVPSIRNCQNAIVRNLTNKTLHFNFNFVVKGSDGSHWSSTASIGGTTFNGGANTGYYMTGLGPGQATTVPVYNVAAVSCDGVQTVSWSTSAPVDVDAHNQRVSSNESAERRALGTMIDNWNNKETQRKQERAEQRKIEAAKNWEEERRRQEKAEADRPCAQLGQYCDRRIKGLPKPTTNHATDDARERALNELRARQAEEQRQLDRDREIRETEIAREHAERQAALQRDAEAKAARAQAEWKAQQAAAQRAAQAAQERRLAEAAAERRRQEQWQQQVNATTSLLQGSIQNSESALAASKAKLDETVSSYDKEDAALAEMIAKAKAAAQAKK